MLDQKTVHEKDDTFGIEKLKIQGVDEKKHDEAESEDGKVKKLNKANVYKTTQDSSEEDCNELEQDNGDKEDNESLIERGPMRPRDGNKNLQHQPYYYYAVSFLRLCYFKCG